MDMYLKSKKIGKIERSNCFVYHYHYGYLKKKTAEKEKQNANTYGCLFRIYGFKVPGLYRALIKLVISPNYAYWFFRGFIKKKQDFKK